jgi:hypothetical protein
VYDFKERLKFGEKHERFLDRYFGDNFTIEDASGGDQRRGIDRYFTDRRNGKTYSIQYKSDETAARTGNAFVETVSVDRDSVPGWAHTCQADFIVYYVVGCGPAYVIRPGSIKKKLPEWAKKYPSRSIPNKGYGRKGYNTIGLLVPLVELERIAHTVANP